MSSTSSNKTYDHPILVTGAAGNYGGVGRKVVELLRQKGLPVRALVHREDERAEALRKLGAEVVLGDLTKSADVVRVTKGVRRVYFGMSLTPAYLEASVIIGAALLQEGNTEVLVNISQMTVSDMSLERQTTSTQQRQHFLAEQALNWSGLPVVHVRPTVFQEHFFFSTWAADSIAKDGTIQLPFGNSSTSPVSTNDVAQVIATILENPQPHIGKVYELTGPKSQDANAIAKEYETALGRPVTYVPVPLEKWQPLLQSKNLPSHVHEHLVTMSKLHYENRYDRKTNDVEKVTGKPATSITEFVNNSSDIFAKARKS